RTMCPDFRAELCVARQAPVEPTAPRVGKEGSAGASPSHTGKGRSLDDDLAGHVRVDGAEVVVGAGCREHEGEGVVGVQGAGVEGPGAGGTGRGMRYVVVVDPGDARPEGDGDLARREGEVVDDDPGRLRSRNGEVGTVFIPRRPFRAPTRS